MAVRAVRAVRRRSAGLVGRGADALEDRRQLLGALLHGSDVVALQSLAERSDLRLGLGLVGRRHLVAEVAERPLGLERERLGLVAGLDLFAALAVLLGVLGGVADHAVHFVLGEHRRGGDADLLLLAGRAVLGLDVEDAVGVDVERDLDLRHAARRGRECRRG